MQDSSFRSKSSSSMQSTKPIWYLGPSCFPKISAMISFSISCKPLPRRYRFTLSMACRKQRNPVAYSKFLVAALMRACSPSVPKNNTFLICSSKATRVEKKYWKVYSSFFAWISAGPIKGGDVRFPVSSGFFVSRRRCLNVVWVTSNLPILKVESIPSMLIWSGFVQNLTTSCNCFSEARTTPNGANL